MRKPISKRTRRTSDEAAMDERLKKEREAEDLDAFLPFYERATGLWLNVEEEAEDPDFICSRSDGMTVGVELTAVWHGREFSLFRSMPEVSAWDVEDDCDHMWGLIEQKTDKLKGYRTKYNALVLQIVEGNFRALADYATEIPIKGLPRQASTKYGSLISLACAAVCILKCRLLGCFRQVPENSRIAPTAIKSRTDKPKGLSAE
jgi:hypothetical protein